MLDRLISFKKEKQLNYGVLAILPPPVEGKADAEGKYLGANKRLLYFNQAFKRLLKGRGIFTIDAFETFSAWEHSFTTDGVHLNEKAQNQLSMDIQLVLLQK
jgi:lysophospholipase L1-like esterase